jgi:hypothetical protein
MEIAAASELVTAPAAPAIPSEAMGVRRKERLRMLPVVTTSYVVDTALLLCFCLAAALPWSMPPVFLASGLLVCTGVRFILDSDLSERLRDHHMVMEQMVANCTLLMAYIVWTPQVGAALMMLSFVIFAFGVLRMKFRSVVSDRRALPWRWALSSPASATASVCRWRRQRSAPSVACGSPSSFRASPSLASKARICAPCLTNSGPS